MMANLEHAIVILVFSIWNTSAAYRLGVAVERRRQERDHA